MEKEREKTHFQFSSDECGVSGGEEDSDEDVVTEYQVVSVLNEKMKSARDPGQSNTHGTLPTISVTAHSPANKSYLVLEDSIKHVRDLSETVHQMRHQSSLNSATTQEKNLTSVLNPFLTQVARLSASCPALNEIMRDLGPFDNFCELSSLRNHSRNRGNQDILNEPETNKQRRRSWTALEDLREGSEVVKQRRQRSISLSSMESEADESFWDNVDGSTVRLLEPDRPAVIRHRVNRASGGGASTHSLNEADLQNDFNKLKAKREIEKLILLPQRLPLQKSISTPSIIAAGDLSVEPELVGTQPTLPIASYERHTEKRRKRGSLFFRKKKSKTKKLHQWVSSYYGSSQICDSCNKALGNKPALYCECCGTTVHQNACKDDKLECTKSKGFKGSGKLVGFPMPISSNKNSLTKRGSGSGNIYNSSSQILMGDDKDDHHGHHDNTNFPDDVPLVPLEFLTDFPLTASDLCTNYALGLNDNEPESWSPCVGKEVTEKLIEIEVKRQEHIYEFILTEKHHCMTLLVMQKIFYDGLQKHFQLGPNLERMFPRLTDLIKIHLDFLSRLRQRQRESPIVNSIADIILDMFSNNSAVKLKSAYGEFCSRHRYANEIYKECMQKDARFVQFVKHCQQNPLLKKKGIPECILFVTQRLTKYPLLIEPLIKTSKGNELEQVTLKKSLANVKDILEQVDAQVAEIEKENRKIEIYNNIDAKSSILYKGHKFKKSDILQGNRSLKFEGVASMPVRGKTQTVLVIVLSDLLFFLQENSHKYHFSIPDNNTSNIKIGVFSLQKLLIREKAEHNSKVIYLISSETASPVMLELTIHEPKNKHIWIEAIRKAVQTCAEDELVLNPDERKNLLHKQAQVKQLIGQLREKDLEQALLLEEKMILHLRLMEMSGLDPPSPPSYRHLVNENVNIEKMWKEVLMAVQEVTHLASSLYNTGTNLSRSVSSAGEHQSTTYVSPVLPKRADTFGGFDYSNLRLFHKKINSPEDNLRNDLKPNDSKLFESLPFRNCVVTSGNPSINGNNDNNELQISDTNLSSLGRDQQYAAIKLSHYVYMLLCIISQLMTSNECLRTETASSKNTDGSKLYKHNQQLEELRNLQDKLSKEKAEWAVQKQQDLQEMEDKKKELQKIQEQIRLEQIDIKQQRDQLYRKMEVLTSQGLLISPNISLPVAGQLEDKEIFEENSLSDNSTSNSLFHNNFTSTIEKRKEKWNKINQPKSQLPLNLISTTNQSKIQSSVKQQLPLKLASRLSTGSINVLSNTSGMQQVLPLKLQKDEKEKKTNTLGYQRLGSDNFNRTSDETTTMQSSHSRTGSSPALMQESPITRNQTESPIKTARTNSYPKFPDKFKVKNNEKPTEEEVIYF